MQTQCLAASPICATDVRVEAKFRGVEDAEYRVHIFGQTRRKVNQDEGRSHDRFQSTAEAVELYSSKFQLQTEKEHSP